MADPGEPRSSADSEVALADHIRGERVRFVFIQSTLPIIFSPVAALILTVALWHAVSHERLVWFAAGAIVIAVQRVIATRMFPDPLPSGLALRRWEWTYVGSIMLVDLWWGFWSLFLIVPGANTESALVFSFVMLLAGGHTASYSAHPPTVVLGVLALTLPITIAFALEPDTFHWPLAFVSLMFIAASFRSIRSLSYFFGRTYRLAHELQLERDRAEQLARNDALTGLANRRAFYERGEALLVASAPQDPVAMLMVDIDHFKAVNDRLGHAAGDEVLRAVSRIIADHAPPGAICARLGGEEFALLFVPAAASDAQRTAEALVVATAATPVACAGHVLPVTVSAGIAARRVGEPLDALVGRADAALYAAKRAGRNRAMA